MGLTIATTTPLPAGIIGLPYSLLFQATGGIPPYKWSVSAGRLPSGLKLNGTSGLLSGKSTIPGTNTFRVAVSDSTGQSISNNFVLIVRDVFRSLAGTYTGLILQTNTPTYASSGFIQIVVSKAGAFASNLSLAGQKTTVKGQFDLTGNATNTVARASMALHLDIDGTGRGITGKLNGNGFTSDLLAELPGTAAMGTYTLVFSPTDAALTNLPQGYGYATLIASRKGSSSLRGVLNDGAKLSAKAPVSRSGRWPLYVSLYNNTGGCIGWVNFATNSTAEAVVDWFAPASKGYAAFTTTLMVDGSKYTSGPQPLSGDWNVTFSGGGLASNLVNVVTLDAAGKVTITQPGLDGLTLKLTIRSGLLTGSFKTTGVGTALPFNGLLLQVQEVGAGLFQTTTGQTGGITLEPSR